MRGSLSIRLQSSDLVRRQKTSGEWKSTPSFGLFVVSQVDDASMLSAFFLKERSLLSNTWGASLWQNDTEMDLIPVTNYQPSEQSYLLIQVSVIEGEGSWWLPATSEESAPTGFWDQNGGYSYLQLESASCPESDFSGERLITPSSLYWWIPAASFSGHGIQPQMVPGQISGRFPCQAPDAPSVSVTKKIIS